MAILPVAHVTDIVLGHHDVQGVEIPGNITTGNASVRNGGYHVACTDDIITIPSHAHQLDEHGAPTDFRSHTWRIVGTGKHTIAEKELARQGDGGNDDDWDGYQDMPSALQIQASTTTLYSA